MSSPQELVERHGVRLAGVASEVRQALLKRRKPTVGPLNCGLLRASVQWNFSVATDPLTLPQFNLAFNLSIFGLPEQQFGLTVWPWRIHGGIPQKNLFVSNGPIAEVGTGMQLLEEWAAKRAVDIGVYLDSILTGAAPHHWMPRAKADSR